MVALTLTLDAAKAKEINDEMRRVNKMDDPDKPNQWNETPFTLENYDKLWTLEISYSLAIKAEGSDKFGTPTESYVTAAKNQAAWIDD